MSKVFNINNSVFHNSINEQNSEQYDDDNNDSDDEEKKN